MKTVALVTAHFPPSNLTGVHRARIWSQHLPEFGWTPIVVTTNWDYYEEGLDWHLMELVDPSLKVIRTKAFRTKPVRLIGNIALRSLYWTYKALDDLWSKKQLDFVHLIVPDHYSAVLGPLLFRKHRLPYGIDYMDPWVHAHPREKPFLSKAWVSCCLSYLLEPWSIRNARLITGVAPLYFDGVFARNPEVLKKIQTAAMPQINPESDFDAAREKEPAKKLFKPNSGHLNFVYAGTLTPRMLQVLRYFFDAAKILIERGSSRQPVRFTFIGTGSDPRDPNSGTVTPLAEELGLEAYVKEYPGRIGYLDTLWHLTAASAVLVIGSTERHYTPSKIYQAIQSGRPVMALLRSDSPACEVVRASGQGEVVEISDEKGPPVTAIVDALANIINRIEEKREVLGVFSARWSSKESTRVLAAALDRAVASRS